jgi:hypothetical protein
VLISETVVLTVLVGCCVLLVQVFSRKKMNLVIILMIVVFLVTAGVLAKQKSTGEDVTEMKKFLSTNREGRKTIA